MQNETATPDSYGNIRNTPVTVAFFMNTPVNMANPIQVTFSSGQSWINQMRNPLINGLYQFYNADSEIVFINAGDIMLVALVVTLGGSDELQ